MNLFFYTFVQILTVYIGQNNKLSLREYVLYVSFSFIDILFQGISHKSMFLEVPEKPSERFIFFFGPPDLLDILFRRIGSISVFPIVLKSSSELLIMIQRKQIAGQNVLA